MTEPKGKQPKPTAGKTPFESMSQEQLFALLTPANKDTAMTLAGKLAKASDAITKIGEDLKLRVSLVKWEGEGADAFKDWAGQTANATVRLGDYAKEAGKWMDDVAQAIAEAHSGLDDLKTTASSASSSLSDAKKTHYAAVHDPGSGPTAAKDARTDMDLARASMESARLASVQRLTKLGQTYTQSAEQMNKLEAPTFPPPAAQLGDEWVTSTRGYGRYETTSRSESSGTAETAVSRRAQTETGTDTVSVGKNQIDGETSTVVHTIRPDRPVDMEIDSVGTLPPQTITPPATTIVPPVSGKPDGPVIAQGVIPPAFGGPNTGGPTAGSPAGRAVPSARGVVPPGQTGLTRGMPRADGIVGGRPVTPATGRPTGGIPRGTVVGHEGTTGARGQMGRGMTGMPGMHGGGPAGGAGQSGISGGRRLASEAGGVVGGRQQPGQTSARPFTPGGSGLVRGANAGTGAGGAVPAGQAGRVGGVPAGSPNSGRRQDEQGERPDYLTEDEETWQQGSNRVVPPVID